MRNPRAKLSMLIWAISGWVLATSAAEAQTTWFVDANGFVGGGCTSWADACPSLQTAMGLANPGDAIWVATGTYMPDGGYTPIGDIHIAGSGGRTATFQLLNGVAIYGGFTGTEDPATFDLADRDFIANETILSGDLNGDDAPVTDPVDLFNEPTRAENSFHVAKGNGTNTSAVLDGFIIADGNANGPGSRGFNLGGGMRINNGHPTLTDCLFIACSALSGGGMVNNPGSPQLTRCWFIGNSAISNGGAIYNTLNSSPKLISCIAIGNTASFGGAISGIAGTSPLLINCALIANIALVKGGGLNAFNGSFPSLVNCTLIENIAAQGGGVASVDGGSGSSDVTILNCILWNNQDDSGEGESAQINYQTLIPVVDHSCIQGLTGGLGGVGNIGDDPMFVDPLGSDGVAGTEDDDLRLMPGSPCIDAGNNASVPADIADLDGDGDMTEPTPFDLDGNPRIVNGTVDMGAYEVYQVFDCNYNGVPDDQDIADGMSADCNGNGIPDECDGFIDTTPPEIACSIVPVPEDDSEEGGDEGYDEGYDNDIQQSGGSGSGLSLILFETSDDCGPFTVSAIIDIGCMQIFVENGTVIAFNCEEGDECEAQEEDGILEIEATSAVLIVTAVDESGNTSTCEIVICTPEGNSGDDNDVDEGADNGGSFDSLDRIRSRLNLGEVQ